MTDFWPFPASYFRHWFWVERKVRSSHLESGQGSVTSPPGQLSPKGPSDFAGYPAICKPVIFIFFDEFTAVFHLELGLFGCDLGCLFRIGLDPVYGLPICPQECLDGIRVPGDIILFGKNDVKRASAGA